MPVSHTARAVIGLAAVTVGIPIALLAAGWLWILLSPAPLATPIAGWVPWPIACTTHGCISTAAWLRQQQLAQAFAQTTKTDQPAAAETLTSVLRRHMVEAAVLRSPVTLLDATRYRENVLRISSAQQLQTALPISLDTYDSQVVLPYLEQEALKQDRHLATNADLYVALARERFILMLPFHFQWDTHKGVVVQR
jgi:hypothetical protein